MADVPPEAGPERLTALLRRAGVLERGVRGYRLDALWLDYRHSVLWQITTPMWQANHGLPTWVWWNHLERIMQAVHDLDCRELLG